MKVAEQFHLLSETESSCRPVPLHPLVLNALLEWRAKSPYSTDVGFLFPSVRFKGSKPLSPDSILEKRIRPALAMIGVVGRHIGWHSFRHSLATNLRSLGVDIKVAQEFMRHSSCRTTLDIYTRAVDQRKRDASLNVVEMMLPLEVQKLQHPRETGLRLVGADKYLRINELLVDLVGIEPTTSSMPWKRAPSCATGPHGKRTTFLLSALERGFVKHWHGARRNVVRAWAF